MTVLQEREMAGPGLPVVHVVCRDQDVRRAGWLQAQLEDVLRVRPDRVVVDLSACPTLDSASLRTLLDVHCELRRQGGHLVLRGLSPRVDRVIGVAGLTGVFDVEAARSDAARSDAAWPDAAWSEAGGGLPVQA